MKILFVLLVFLVFITGSESRIRVGSAIAARKIGTSISKAGSRGLASFIKTFIYPQKYYIQQKQQQISERKFKILLKKQKQQQENFYSQFIIQLIGVVLGIIASIFIFIKLLSTPSTKIKKRSQHHEALNNNYQKEKKRLKHGVHPDRANGNIYKVKYK